MKIIKSLALTLQMAFNSTLTRLLSSQSAVLQIIMTRRPQKRRLLPSKYLPSTAKVKSLSNFLKMWMLRLWQTPQTPVQLDFLDKNDKSKSKRQAT
jgi:hypothetical protein